MSLNCRAPKLDIIGWNADYQKIDKKITLSTEELRELNKILNYIPS